MTIRGISGGRGCGDSRSGLGKAALRPLTIGRLTQPQPKAKNGHLRQQSTPVRRDQAGAPLRVAWSAHLSSRRRLSPTSGETRSQAREATAHAWGLRARQGEEGVKEGQGLQRPRAARRSRRWSKGRAWLGRIKDLSWETRHMGSLEAAAGDARCNEGKLIGDGTMIMDYGLQTSKRAMRGRERR